VLGGQGQDRTLNWFSQLGVEHRLTDHLSLRLSGYFQHHSNGGATDPNPGLNSLGVLGGVGWTF
jgi:lipid A 3-O-deacylase